jgi:hypothetical protein
MKIAISELEHLREEIKNCHRIIKDLQKKSEFVGLTNEEMNDIWSDQKRSGESITRAIEAKLKEKNT